MGSSTVPVEQGPPRPSHGKPGKHVHLLHVGAVVVLGRGHGRTVGAAAAAMLLRPLQALYLVVQPLPLLSQRPKLLPAIATPRVVQDMQRRRLKVPMRLPLLIRTARDWFCMVAQRLAKSQR